MLDLAAGFVPAATDLFAVVQAGSISGAFANAAVAVGYDFRNSRPLRFE